MPTFKALFFATSAAFLAVTYAGPLALPGMAEPRAPSAALTPVAVNAGTVPLAVRTDGSIASDMQRDRYEILSF